MEGGGAAVQDRRLIAVNKIFADLPNTIFDVMSQAAQKFIDVQRRTPDSELNSIWKKHFGRTLTEFIALMVAVK